MHHVMCQIEDMHLDLEIRLSTQRNLRPIRMLGQGERSMLTFGTVDYAKIY